MGSRFPEMMHLGGEDCVTGSCHLMRVNGLNVMVDRGRRGGGSVWIGGERFSVKARVHELGGYSAHADQRGLVEWAEAIRPARVKLVHGEPGARKALGDKMKSLVEEEGLNCVRLWGVEMTVCVSRGDAEGAAQRNARLQQDVRNR